MSGVPEAQTVGAGVGIRIIPGIELSARVPTGQMHLLGYFPDANPAAVLARLSELRALREERARGVVERLAAIGATVDWDDVRARAREAIGRPHIADSLVAAGHATDRSDAFERFLAEGRPGYIASVGLSPEDALALVRASGGAPVLAHPATLRQDPSQLDVTVERLARAGLIGIEVHRPEHTRDQRRQYGWLATRHGLVAAGGSDFHSPDWKATLGDTGHPALPADVIDRLLHRADAGRG